MKLIINMIMGTMMTAFAEGLSLGDRIGLEKNEILDVIAQGAINSPLFQYKGLLRKLHFLKNKSIGNPVSIKPPIIKNPEPSGPVVIVEYDLMTFELR